MVKIDEAFEMFASDPTKIPLLAIVGPTAGGKSGLAVALAEKYNGEVVSCDSMQVYRRMNIGTAKPTKEEMQGIPHYMIDIVEPTEVYSCAEYVSGAKKIIVEIHERGKLPVLCGGTGLYLDRLLRGGSDNRAVSSPDVREELEQYRLANGNHALHNLLREVDPESADAIHENNIPRVIRALEIYRVTGRTKTESDRMTSTFDESYCPYVLGLHWERGVLRERINLRVDQMMYDGLVAETEQLLREGVFEVNATASSAIGYKELLPYLDGKESLAEATEKLKTATAQYAKRQMTWFKAKTYVHWVDMT